VAIVANSLTPYRLNVHCRLAREIPEIRLWSVFTHETSQGADWEFNPPAEIGPVSFGHGQSSAIQGQFKHALGEWRKGARIIRWMIEHDIRAVIVNGYNDLGRLRIIRWCHCNRIPCFVQGDSNVLNDRARGLKLAFKRIFLNLVLSRVSGALPVGTAGVAYFKKYGVPENRCFIFPLEPDYDQILNLPQQRIDEARARFMLSPDRRRIVFSGRLLQLKRVDLLIDAFNAIADRRPQWDLLIIGDGDIRPQLQARLRKDLEPRVQWTGFLNDQSLVSALYRLCDLLVLPSEREAWALVINEAAAAGLAMISSSIPGAAVDLIRENVNGRIFPSGDLAAFIDCLLDVTVPSRIDAMKAASPRVLQEWRRCADSVQTLRRVLRFCGVLPASS
jgi:glycosyltransferase involved in cell wall biosynthesis